MGRPVVALRGDHRAGRQGPVDGRWLARPERRDRPRGVRARAAAQRPVRVPQHRRQEDVDAPRVVGAAAHTIAEVIPPEQLRFLFLRPRPNQAIEFDPDGTDAVPRLFDEFDKFAAATAGREVKGELPPGYEATFRYSLLDPNADVAAEAAALPTGVRAPRAARPDPGRRRRGAGRGGEGESADRARARRSSTNASPRRAHGWRPTPRSAPRLAVRTTRCRPRPALDDPTSVAFLAALADAVEAQSRRPVARPGRRSSSTSPTDDGAAAAAGPSRRSTSRSSAGRTAREPAGCSPASIRSSSSARLREAAAAAGPHGRRRRMSVGLQRLREDADADPRRRRPEGRGPGARRSRPRARRRAAPPARRERGPQGRTQRRLEADRRGDQGGRRARWPRGRRPAGRLDRGRRPDHGPRRVPGRDRRRPRRPAPAHPEPARPRHPGRWRGGERHRSGCGASSWPTTSRSSARSAPTPRRAARPGPASRTGSSARRSTSSTTPAAPRSPAPGFPVYKGAGSALQRAPHQLVPRRPHPRERDDRGLAAGRRQHGLARPAPARSPTRKTRCTS